MLHGLHALDLAILTVWLRLWPAHLELSVPLWEIANAELNCANRTLSLSHTLSNLLRHTSLSNDDAQLGLSLSASLYRMLLCDTNLSVSESDLLRGVRSDFWWQATWSCLFSVGVGDLRRLDWQWLLTAWHLNRTLWKYAAMHYVGYL